MKLSELIKESHDVEIAVVPETNADGSISWFIYLLNKSENILSNILVQSSGEGEIDAWPVKSSVLKHFYEELLPYQFIKVEMLVQEVFILKNKYWVSFYKAETIFDKQFFFAPNSIHINSCLPIPLLAMDVILAK